MNISKELSDRELSQCENSFRHSSYEAELEFYSAVKAGDDELVKQLYTPLDINEHGKLSNDKLRNIKYHFVVTAAMITRFCIEGGMAPARAFTISDICINKCDACSAPEQVAALHKETVMFFTSQMKTIASKSAYSKHILMCIDYIYENIYSGVTVQDAADHLGLTPQYLSKLFRQEVGVKLSDFIMTKRITAAENMLKFSEYTPLDIGNYLCFSSHSHFISSFKKKTGMTPRQYRDNYFRSNWRNNID
ncbi:MAG: helix-turn-helix domain-containing protein [Oscillospiraceae bacterium]